MTRIATIRSEIQRLMKAVPFRPFALNMENGDRIIIEHPENIAFDPSLKPGKYGSADFYVISKRLRLSSTFDAATSVAVLDRGD